MKHDEFAFLILSITINDVFNIFCLKQFCLVETSYNIYRFCNVLVFVANKKIMKQKSCVNKYLYISYKHTKLLSSLRFTIHSIIQYHNSSEFIVNAFKGWNDNTYYKSGFHVIICLLWFKFVMLVILPCREAMLEPIN